MRADPKIRDALHRIARLQDLRVAQTALLLDTAQQAHRAAATREDTAARSLQRQEAELADLLDRDSFDPAALAMKGRLVVDQAGLHGEAKARAASARTTEEDRQLAWQASRYQRDWLHARHREAERKLRRKDEEKSLGETAALTAIRTGGQRA